MTNLAHQSMYSSHECAAISTASQVSTYEAAYQVKKLKLKSNVRDKPEKNLISPPVRLILQETQCKKTTFEFLTYLKHLILKLTKKHSQAYKIDNPVL